MPYDGELANKSSHSDIVKNPDVARFLSECDYIKEPSDEEGQALAARFFELPPVDQVSLPERIIAVDGSLYEASIDERLPSTKLGFVKIGSILIDMTQFKSLRVNNGRMVDPFRVAKLQNNHDALTFPLPSANIRWKDKKSVQEGFRATIDGYLYGLKTRFNDNDPTTSLRTTLFHLASRRVSLGTNDIHKLIIHKCPNPDCEQELIEVQDIPDPQHCPTCEAEVYPSDCLRLWEQVSDYQSNNRAISLFMTAVEHLMPVHYIRYLAEKSLPSLGSVAFFVDGPLAIFDVTAWLIDPIMRFLIEVNQRLTKAGYPKLLIIGLQKTGQVVDHVSLIDKFIPSSRFFPIDDDYRYQYILTGRDPSEKGFGSQTYYGQDFIYKTPSGRTFVFGLPYPFASKSSKDFADRKSRFESYSEFPRALKLINHFETDLYKNAVVPIALAHRYTAISLVPGGRVLDLLTRNALRGK